MWELGSGFTHLVCLIYIAGLYQNRTPLIGLNDGICLMFFKHLCKRTVVVKKENQSWELALIELLSYVLMIC